MSQWLQPESNGSLKLSCFPYEVTFSFVEPLRDLILNWKYAWFSIQKIGNIVCITWPKVCKFHSLDGSSLTQAPADTNAIADADVDVDAYVDEKGNDNGNVIDMPGTP